MSVAVAVEVAVAVAVLVAVGVVEVAVIFPVLGSICTLTPSVSKYSSVTTF